MTSSLQTAFWVVSAVVLVVASGCEGGSRTCEQCRQASGERADACAAECSGTGDGGSAGELPMIGGGGGPPGMVEREIDATTISRTSGVAPLAVHFSVSGDRGTDAERPFHELVYSWDFGDPDSGEWTLWRSASASRNRAHGPVAGHVYERPGSYRVVLTITAPDGTQTHEEAAIEVQDPDVVFAGDRTLCVSSRGDFAGCPDGARTATHADLLAVQSELRAGTRTLLRRGETWSIAGQLAVNEPGPGHLGAFGEGPAPRITRTTEGNIFRLSDGEDPVLRDWRFSDLELAGAHDQASAFSFAGHAEQVSILRVQMHDLHIGVSASPNVTDFLGHEVHDQLAIVDTSMERTVGGSGGNAAYLGARRLMFLGNRFHDTTAGEHVLRTPWLIDSVIAYNDLSSPGCSKQALKLHAPDFEERAPRYSERIVVAHNLFTSGCEDWTAGIGPQDETSDQRVRTVLVESNFFRTGTAQVALLIWARDITVRNNLFDVTSEGGATCISIYRRGIEPPPAAVDIFHNTCHSASGEPQHVSVPARSAEEATQIVIRNNLVSYASGAPGDPSGPGVTAGDNVFTTAPGFAASTPVDALDFRITAGSPALDRGEAINGVRYDMIGEERPAQGIDVGAFERTE